MADELRIIIRRGLAGQGFIVRTEPTIESADRDGFQTLKDARGWAGGQRLIHRGTIIDETGEVAHG